MNMVRTQSPLSLHEWFPLDASSSPSAERGGYRRGPARCLWGKPSCPRGTAEERQRLSAHTQCPVFCPGNRIAALCILAKPSTCSRASAPGLLFLQTIRVCPKMSLSPPQPVCLPVAAVVWTFTRHRSEWGASEHLSTQDCGALPGPVLSRACQQYTGTRLLPPSMRSCLSIWGL